MTSPMTRMLGRSGIQVSAMGLGCWAIGGPLWSGEAAVGWGEVDDRESIRAIHCALELGVTFFDTADVYGAGHSEQVLGRALAGRRDRAVMATKFGNRFDESRRQITGSDASAEYIRRACQASRRRLNVDTIDLYQLHLNDYDPQKAGMVRDVLEELVAEGQIRHYGWSTDYPERAQLFAQGPNCTAAQFQMNVLDDAGPMVTLCEEFNLAGINRGPLAMGLLTGKYRPESVLPADDVRGRQSPAWMKYYRDGRPNPEWFRKVEAIREILTSNGRTLAQGALAWLWGRSEQTLPIPGFRTVKQVEENAAAMGFGPLAPSQIDEIDRLLDR
jgi:aryl-alcohol dehydrogenase-like predicted oxidoreductase